MNNAQQMYALSLDQLVDKVLKQIKKDVEAGDMTAIEELLGDVSEKNLRSFLSEEEKE